MTWGPLQPITPLPPTNYTLEQTLNCKYPCTLCPTFSYVFYFGGGGGSYSSSFPIKMLASDAKTQKIEFYDARGFRGSV